MERTQRTAVSRHGGCYSRPSSYLPGSSMYWGVPSGSNLDLVKLTLWILGGTVLKSGTLLPTPFPPFMDRAFPRVLSRIKDTGAFNQFGDGPNHVGNSPQRGKIATERSTRIVLGQRVESTCCQRGEAADPASKISAGGRDHASQRWPQLRQHGCDSVSRYPYDSCTSPVDPVAKVG